MERTQRRNARPRNETDIGLINVLGLNSKEHDLIVITVGYCHDIYKYRIKIPYELCHLITFFIGTLFKFVDRFGFPMLSAEQEDIHKIRVRKENVLLDKWTNILFKNQKIQFVDPYDWNYHSSDPNDQQLKHWKRVKNKHESKIKSMIRSDGIPQSLRPYIWPNLVNSREIYQNECNRYNSPTMFNDLINNLEENIFFHDSIWSDICKTYTKNIRNNEYGFKKHNVWNQEWKQKYYHIKFQDINNSRNIEKYATPTQMDLYNILKAFCLFRKDIGYINGMHFVVAMLLMFTTQEHVFWILLAITDNTAKYGIDNLWRYGNPSLPLRLFQLNRFIKKILPKIYKHFEKNRFKIDDIATPCFISIFLSTNMKFECLVRVWDLYLNEGIKTIFRMIVGYLKYNQLKLLKCNDKNELMNILNVSWSTLKTDQYWKICFSSKMMHSELKSFERDYITSYR